MLYLKIFTFLTIIGFINCANVTLGEEIESGNWTSRHRSSFPFTVGGKHYFFGLRDIDNEGYWFIQELREDGKTASETSQGRWQNYYTQVFPFSITTKELEQKQFIYGISDQNYWCIQEILPGGIMGRETDNGYWESKPTIIFPFDIGGKHYVYSLSDTKWFIKELLPNGKMGSETDHGTWKYHYTIGFPFSINGRQYFYCVSEKYWFIQELVPGGKMGKETDNGYWKTNHILNVPFIIDGKNYFYGLTDNDTRYWFIQELLPAGKMGPEKMYGTWEHYYEVVFAFNINGRQFLYRLSEYSWFIHEIIKEPRFPTRTVEKEKYCNPESVLRNKQDNNCTCNAECGVTGLNVLEGYITDIENDNDNYLTTTYSYPDFPILSVSTFRVAADANNARSIELTAAIRAEIHYSHMFQIRCPIVSAEVRAHLQQMNREDDDEAGHLLASSLGGSGLPYNFAPQSPMLKRVQCVNVSGSVISQPGWYDVEELLRDYLLRYLDAGYIRWSLVPQYSLLPNSRRPTAFLLSVQFYNDQGELVNWGTDGAVHFYQFQNVPTTACTNYNHQWWNHI